MTGRHAGGGRVCRPGTGAPVRPGSDRRTADGERWRMTAHVTDEDTAADTAATAAGGATRPASTATTAAIPVPAAPVPVTSVAPPAQTPMAGPGAPPTRVRPGRRRGWAAALRRWRPAPWPALRAIAEQTFRPLLLTAFRPTLLTIATAGAAAGIAVGPAGPTATVPAHAAGTKTRAGTTGTKTKTGTGAGAGTGTGAGTGNRGREPGTETGTATGAETRTAPQRPAPLPPGTATAPWRPRFPQGRGLEAVSLLYLLVQLTLVVPHLAHVLGWDETVYVSQVDPRTPAAFFSAPRSRGISVLVSPVLAVTDSVLALRIALALLSTAALYAAYRVWRPLLGPATTALAALVFSGLWIAQISGPEAMPNLWVALGAVAATGLFLRAPREPNARWWLAACLAGVALMRVPDAAWLGLPLFATAGCVRSHRRTLPYLLGGLAAGATQWTVEAYSRFGGVPQRLHVSGATEGGMHPHLNLFNAWRSLNGPELCRPCSGPVHHPELTLWWLALPLLALAALAVALRERRTGVPADRTLVPLAVAVCLSAPYLLLLSYSAPRFLLPAYALLALPVGGLLTRVARPRPALAVTVGCLVALQLVAQYPVLHRMTAQVASLDQRYRVAADELNALGLRAPCLLVGSHAQPVGYDAGCASAATKGNNRNTTPSSVLRRAERMPTAVLTADAQRPPRYARDWTRHPLPGTDGWTAWLAPAPGASR
ncbi:putative membrane protein [Streptomyces avermitilis MA-4680 = NBRC 14893]|uniref:Membrane protein n=2 Tax=Streptomyces TaxID=1883 RepID=Q82E51_STRAW|nr:putative membrane protein [Streptomyces avermitilis MA-4680 = NBRC 14893]